MACLLLLGAAGTSHGALFQVTKTQDTNDGVCNADCSLREAILAANGSSGQDYITLPAGRYTLTIPGSGEDNGATGDLDVRDGPLFIGGQGPEETIVDASGLGDRALHVFAPDTSVVLVGLTVTGGTSPIDGGGIFHQQGHLYLTNVTVRDNQAAGAGGGVYAWAAEVTVQQGSVISRNSAGWDGHGGGIFGNNLTVTDSTVSGNEAGTGGGLATLGNLTVRGSTIAYNQSLPYDGGGIEAGSAVVEVSNSTVIGNFAIRHGEAIHAWDGTNLSLHSVTFSGNSAPTDNTLYVSLGSSVSFINTLISGSCFWESSTSYSYGGNLESPGNGCGFNDPSDHVNVADPMLAPLAPYGGPTRTLLPRLGSPAIGGGSTDLYCLSEDQRGELRSDGDCDVGAVERQAGEQDPLFVDGFESGNTSAW